MAKANDGNLLQHFTECQVSSTLAGDAVAHSVLAEASRDLHVVCTHAMAPYEEAETKTEDAFNATLHRVLSSATKSSDWPVLAAYARTGASLERFPNTAELLAALRGDDHLSGILCEKDGIHASVLANRWAGSALRVRAGNWRSALERGHLEPAEDHAHPWLFTLDPYTWLLAGQADKAHRGANLCRADLELLRPLFGRYASGKAPGAAVLLVYELDAAHAADFRRSAIHLADRLGLERTFLGIAAAGDARHLAAVLSPTAGLAAQVAEAWGAFRAEVSAG